MPNQMLTTDPVSFYYENLRSAIADGGIRFLFLAEREYLQREYGIRVVITAHSKVPRRGAIGARTKNGKFYLILVNPQDAQDNHDIVRLRVAHELGHAVCWHLEEGQYLFEKQLGRSGSPASKYDRWRQLVEDEADVFAMNMFLAHGPVVERRIPSEEEYRKNVGDMYINVRPTNRVRPSILNEPGTRKAIFCSLRDAEILHPPLPILCHTLVEVLGAKDEVVWDGKSIHRRAIAEGIHRTYRKRLSNRESKPMPDKCLACPDCHKQYCFDSL